MKLIYYEEIDSTQLQVKRLLGDNYKAPFCVLAKRQTAGIGSRCNDWTSLEGNALFSFVLNLNDLPQDLLLQSAAIYFGFLLKIILAKRRSQAFLKWPNDIYIQDDKIGGIISHKYSSQLICGIGLNLNTHGSFRGLDINLSIQDLLDDYFMILREKRSWSDIIQNFSQEFYKCHNFCFQHNEKSLKLALARLNSDGSLSFGGKNIFALR